MFYDRMDFVPQTVVLSVEHRWSVGCGPGGAPYRKSLRIFGLSGKIFANFFPDFP